MYTTGTFSGFAILLFVGMLSCLEIGRRLGRRWRTTEGEAAVTGTGGVEGAVLALLGLLLAFTFGGASSRFDVRRNLVIEETNDIGTAWLRLDLLPAADQPVLRQLFREYTEARLAVYRDVSDIEAVKREQARCAALQSEIWSKAVAASGRSPSPQAAMLLLPALNAMIDITTTRTAAADMHPPLVVFAMLYAVALVSSLMAGFGMAASHKLSRLHALGFTMAMAAAFYVIVDMEYPRVGQIRVDSFDQYLVQVRASMK